MEPPPPDGLTAVALVIAPGAFIGTPGVFIDSPDPVTPSDVVMLVEPGDVVTEELPDGSEDVLLPGTETMAFIDDA